METFPEPRDVKLHEAILDLYYGLYPSDRYPVVVELSIPKVSQPGTR